MFLHQSLALPFVLTVPEKLILVVEEILIFVQVELNLIVSVIQWLRIVSFHHLFVLLHVVVLDRREFRLP